MSAAAFANSGRSPAIRRLGFVLLLGLALPALCAGSAAAVVSPPKAPGAGGGELLSEDQLFEDGTPGGARIPGRYIVVLEDSVGRPGRLARAQANQRGGKLGFVYRHALKGYSVSGLSKGDVKALRNDPRVKYVSPDHRVELLEQSTPTGIDRSFAAANENIDINEVDDHRVDADVAVIDSGIDHEHPDLEVVARTLCAQAGESYECSDGIGTPSSSHGTHVAGTVGALDNGEGVVGVAPAARLWSVQVFTSSGAPESQVAAGVDWVTGHAEEIDVANMSLGCKCSMPALEEAIDQSVEAGVVYVVAAGNSSADADGFSPSGHESVITVSALADYDGKAGGEGEPTCNNYGLDDTLATFSNFGADVNVAAPGVCIYSTEPGGGYGYKSGTSMASPHVAGAAALLASTEDPENLADVEAIRQTIEEEGNTAGIAEGGWEDTSGDGIQEPLLDVGDEAAFAPTGQVVVTSQAANLSSGEATLRGNVNPGGAETEYWFEYGTTTEYGSKVPASGGEAGSGGIFVSVEEALEGLQGETTYHYRLVASNETGTHYGLDSEFVTLPPAVTGEAEILSSSEATLRGEVNAGGLETEYWFEYGTTTEYGSKAPASGASAGSGSEYVSVEETLEGLNGQTLYHYRLVASNETGTYYGLDREFGTTPPTVSTQPATGVTANDAKLNATVNPEGFATEYSFEYGPTTAYGRTAPASQLEAGTEAVEVPAELVEGLDGEASYHFRVVATNIAGTTTGEDETLTTSPADWVLEATPKPRAEAEEEEGVTDVGRALESVSCASPTDCVAIGGTRVHYDDTSEMRHHEALHWDGQSWTATELPMPESVDPAGVLMRGISCPSADSCFALGSDYAGGEDRKAFVEHWDGEQWSAQLLPPREEEVETESETEIRNPKGISCASPSSCMAVAVYAGSVTIDAVAIYLWDGKEWSHVPEKPPAEGGNVPAGPSCPAPDACTLVGQDSSGGWSATWNGGSWQVYDIPPLSELSEDEGIIWDGVSCSSPDACMAVGQRADFSAWSFFATQLPTQMVSAVWNGEKWAPISTAKPAMVNERLARPVEPVSCNTASDCVMVTSIQRDGYGQMLTEHWDGEEWSVLSGVNPVWPDSNPLAVSCVQGECRAVGSVWVPLFEAGKSGDGMFVARLQPDDPRFEADEYPATISAEQDPEAKHTFDFASQSISCEQATLAGESSGHSEALELKPSYAGCTNGEWSWTIATNGCSYELDAGNAFFDGEYVGSVDIVCPEGEKLELKGPSGVCEVQIPPQGDLEAITYAHPESSPQQVEATFALTGLEYTEVDTAWCAAFQEAEVTRYDGEYNGGTTIGAENAAEEAIGIAVDGEAAEHDPRFQADEYPATISAEQDPEAKHTFGLNGGSTSCKQATFAGEMGAHSETLALTPSYSECESTGGESSYVSVAANGCSYELDAGEALEGKYSGSVDIVCPEGKQIVFKGAFGVCEAQIPPQSDLEAITYANPESSPQQVEATFALTGLQYTEVDTAFCPFEEAEVTRNDGEYNGGTAIGAENGAEEPIGLRVDGS